MCHKGYRTAPVTKTNAPMRVAVPLAKLPAAAPIVRSSPVPAASGLKVTAFTKPNASNRSTKDTRTLKTTAINPLAARSAAAALTQQQSARKTFNAPIAI